MEGLQTNKPRRFLVHSISSGELSDSSQPQHLLRPRRYRNGKPIVAEHDSSPLPHRKISSYMKATPSIELNLSETIALVKQNRMPEMASSARLPSTASSSLGLTKTGRISKAKKGIKGAHRCGCGKDYSRAEHLRRHQQNHDKDLPCPVFSCRKKFYRQDLFERHIATKHNHQSGSVSRQTSVASDSFSSSSLSNDGFSGAEDFQEPLISSAACNDVQYRIDPLHTRNALFPESSGEPTRYLPSFHSQTSAAFSYPSATVYCDSYPPSNPLDPATQSESSYIKAESYRQPIYPSWGGELHQPETHSYDFGTATPPYTSSGTASPFTTQQTAYAAPWLESNSTYPPTQAFDPLYFAYSSSSIASPRDLAAHMSIPTCFIEKELPAFPRSIVSTSNSPLSSCPPGLAPVMIPQNPIGLQPFGFIDQQDKYGSLDIESPLEEQQLGICLSLKTKQHYAEAFWVKFHPLFPILHKPTHRSAVTSPLLTAAMLAIGAQYTDEQYAKGDARILHEKCLELVMKYKDTLAVTDRLDFMQAIFLVEIFSHYKAKRSPLGLSDIFRAMYDNLWKRHANTAPSYIESLGTMPLQIDDEVVRSRWSQWVEVISFGRLLSACYCFETMQALLLARPLHSASTQGFSLLIPDSTVLWDASTASKWASANRVKPTRVMSIGQTLDNMWNNENHVQRYEPFQCSLLTACHAASVLAQRQEVQSSPYQPASASHALFESANIKILERSYCLQANVMIMHNMVCLASKTPIRALLASSGKSWVLSHRLSGEALLAAAEFASLKNEMRAWTYSAEQPPLFQGTASEGARSAVQSALNILKICLDSDPAKLAFGTEMALYYANLVLWAVTFSAVNKAEAAGFKFEDEEDTAEFETSRAEQNAKVFCEFAKSDIESAQMHGIIALARVDGWRYSVGAVLRWSAWVLGGAGTRSSGVGELMEGAVVVLECLGRRGWNGDWF